MSRRSVVRKALKVLGWALMSAVFAATLAVSVVPRALGAVPLTILSGSMRPGIQPGDVAVVAPQAGGYRRGDVITVQPTYGDPRLITHRVVAVTMGPDGKPARYVTKGDANPAADAPVNADQVHGRMLYTVPLVGWALQALTLMQGTLIIRAVAVLIAAWALTPTKLQSRLQALGRRLTPRRLRRKPA